MYSLITQWHHLCGSSFFSVYNVLIVYPLGLRMEQLLFSMGLWWCLKLLACTILHTSIGKLTLFCKNNFTSNSTVNRISLQVLHCSYLNNLFLSRLMNPFFKALQRMHKDHTNAVLGESTGMTTLVYYQLNRYFVVMIGRKKNHRFHQCNCIFFPQALVTCWFCVWS